VVALVGLTAASLYQHDILWFLVVFAFSVAIFPVSYLFQLFVHRLDIKIPSESGAVLAAIAGVGSCVLFLAAGLLNLERHVVSGPVVAYSPEPSIKDWFEEFDSLHPDLARFPWPPPTPSARERVDPRKIVSAEDANLWDVWNSIEMRLARAGYSELAYLYTPYGFALVTRLEMINDAGRRINSDSPSERPILATIGFSVAKYLQTLFLMPEGRYRTFVFVVTPILFKPADQPDLTKPMATKWFSTGQLALPKVYEEVPFNSSYTVSLLIYEFYHKGREEEPKLLPPEGSMSLKAHLEGAGLAAFLPSP
jgi:hypothetical protein